MRNRFHYKPKHLSRRGRLKSITVLMVLAAFLVVTAAGQSGIAGKAAADSSSWDCGLEEHTHTAECYEADGGTLICDIPEHTHTDMCLASDPSADVETADSWELALPDLTGVWSDDLVAVALSQLGYTESSANFIRADDGETHMGYTRYGAWYGDEYGGWNAMFVSFCLHYAGIPEEEFPEDSDVLALSESLDETGLYIYDTAFKPMAGDLVFFDTGGDGLADRVGIITCICDDTMTVIEGDCEDAVAENTYGKDDGQIIGYGVLPENPDAESGTDDELSLIFEGDDYIVGVTYGSDAMLPDDVTLIASEYGQDSDTYVSRCEEAADFYGWDEEDQEADREIRLFDIGLYTENEDGQLTEVEPAAPVEVTILYLEDNTDEENDGIYTITHFGDEIETVANETVAGDSGEAIMFRLDSFSDIMVMAGNAGDSSTQYVILDIGNENGSWRDHSNQANRYTGYWPWVPIAGYNGAGDYSGFGDDWRITAAIPASNFNGGQMTIRLPGDDDLPTENSGRSTFSICNGVSVSLAKENVSYDYRLVGWINVGTGEYTSVRDGSAEVTISADDGNIFYADWEAASYDVGKSDENVEETVSTDFVTINMFDYNELFNLYSVENEPDGQYTLESGEDSLKENWTIGQNFYKTPVGSKDRTQLDDIGSFAFYDGAAARSQQGFLGYPYGRDTQIGNVGANSDDGNKVNISDHLKATAWDSPFFTQYLFNTNAEKDGVVGVHYVGEGDQLFKYGTKEDELAVENGYEGYYYYDSRYNAANYNQSEGRFYVYNTPSNVTGSSYPEGFFPYNTYSDELNDADGSVNYFFGMSMEVDFYLPNMVGKSNGNLVNGEDMTFNFSGDDDIWIFVDDILVLDMSGVHNKSYGSINFSTGEVTLQTTDTTGGIESTETLDIEGFNTYKYDPDTGTETGESLSFGEHTLRVYYLERGGNSSNMIVSFNIGPSWTYESDTAGAVTVEKQWENSNGDLLTGEQTAECPDVTMGLFEKVEAVNEGADANIIHDGNDYYYVADGVWYKIGEDFYARDGEGKIVAYYDYETTPENPEETRYVYVLVEMAKDSIGDPLFENPVTLSYDEDDSHYGWYYSWELLNQEKVENGDYVVMELSTSSVYTLVRTDVSETDYGYQYWTIIGETEIESWLEENDDNDSGGGNDVAKFPVLLTDAASDDSESVYGRAIYLDVNDKDASGIPTLKSRTLTFSRHPEEVTVTGDADDEDDDDDDTEGTAGREKTTGIYGVVSDTEVSACDPGVIWYLEFAEIPKGDSLDVFYICYEGVNETTGETETWYLAVDYDEDTKTASLVISQTREQSAANGYYDEFYCDELGEIRLYDLQYRLILSSADGSVSVGAIDQDHYEHNNIKIYTLSDVEAPYYSYTFVNKLRPIIVEKVDSRSTEDSTTYLNGATFILSKTVTEESGEGPEPGTYYWSANGWTTNKADALPMVTGNVELDLNGDNEPDTTFRGAIELPYLEDGTYTLTETAAPDGYLLLPSAVTITIEGGTVTSADWADSENVGSSYNGFIEISDSGLTVVLKNQQDYYELPSAGGPGVTWFYMAGSLMMAGGGLLMWRRLRRARC